MFYKTSIIALSFISLISCNAKKDQKKQASSSQTSTVKSMNSDKEEKNVYYFNEGENKFLPEFQMNITFKNIAEDSRCPQGTQCVWEGVAVANVEFMSTTSRPMILQLSTSEVSGKNYHKTQSFNGYNITLHEVTPQPTSDKSKKKVIENYKIGISIAKETDQSNSTTR